MIGAVFSIGGILGFAAGIGFCVAVLTFKRLRAAWRKDVAP